ncbi:hypothetical protein I552_2640 [Mycobacterium xenopi 3993]|nr:hypothetical protein I552_2640 [Mycobacterium xenopi 3993]
MDVCFELATRLIDAMAGAVTVVDEVHGFRFFDNRDLLGFVDGTENPDGPLAVSATQIGDEDPDFAGGCYVHVQKYVHDMAGWNSLSVTEQERAFGRTKLEDIEFDDDEKPANSHLALNKVEDDEGNELKIVRHNMPFGEVGKGEYGTYYIGYSRSPPSPNRFCATCFSAIRPATPIASWTSPPLSPVDYSSLPPSTSSTTHRRCLDYPLRQKIPTPTARWRSAV